MMLTQERARELWHYDSNTGVFTWLVRASSRARAGDVAGRLRHDGYWDTKFNGRTYPAHRLAWLYVYGHWPANDIDHIDGNPLNNRIANLRDVTRSVNGQNRKRAQVRHKIGLLGVSKSRSKFKATINIDGQPTYLGTFATPAQAHSAYLTAKRLHHPGNTI